MTTAAPEPIIYSLLIPEGFPLDDPAKVRDFVNAELEADGFVAVGPATVRRVVDHVSVDGKSVAVSPFGQEPMVMLEMRVEKAPEPKAAPVLPPFVPSREAVEAAAKRLHAKQSGQPWESVPAGVRNGWAVLALEVLGAAAPYLIADSLLHVVEHRDNYGVTDLAQIRDLAKTAMDQAASQQQR